jgi:hypothetical protein
MKFTFMKRPWGKVKAVESNQREKYGDWYSNLKRESKLFTHRSGLTTEQITVYQILERAGSAGLTRSQVAKEMPCSWHVALQILDSLFGLGLTGVYEIETQTTHPDYVFKVYGGMKTFDECLDVTEDDICD